MIKIGGKAFDNPASFKELAAALAPLQGEVALVHGGGAEISLALANAHREPNFIDGFRVTQQQDIEIVEKTLSGVINDRIASDLEKDGLQCQRMSGKTDRLFITKPFRRKGHDYGFVGEIVEVNANVVENALSENKVPIISPISGDSQGVSYNVNADTAAAALAAAMHCTDLVFFTDVPGVSIEGTVVGSMTIEQANRYIQSGDITGGMVAKLESIFDALLQGIQRVHIAQWQGPQTIDQLFSHDHSVGTTIIKEKQ